MVLFFSTLSTASGQDRQVSGSVTDDKGAPLQGVNVVIKGKGSQGTATDSKGGYRLSVPTNNDIVMVFTFVGYETQEIKLGSQNTLNVKMRVAESALSDVFITATSQPVRKIETVTAVESIGPKELARITPINLVDAIRYTPGIYVQTQSGRSRNYIFMRGFPDVVGNGLGYTSLLNDGLRTFTSPEMVPDGAFRYDLNIERIEVVRGSAATLYGRGAAAGAVNVITKTGGLTHAGAARVSVGTNNFTQLDLNLNGPLTKNKIFRYNLGGFLLKDDGFRNNLFPDQGGQIRGNIDYVFKDDKGSFRVSGGYIGLKVQNQLDIPYLSNDFSKPAEGWSTRDVMMPRGVFEGKTSTLTYPDGLVETIDAEEWTKQGNFSKGWNLGYNLVHKLGNGWSVSDRVRYQHITVGIGFDFALSTAYGPNATGVAFQQRANFGGGRTGGGSNARDFINEFRLNKNASIGNAVHNFTLGHYYSTINAKVASRGLIYALDTKGPTTTTQINVAGTIPTLTSLFRNGDYTESVQSIFAGDEIKINGDLTLNLGARYDWINLELIEDRYAYQRNATRTAKHDDATYSAGVNYLIDKNTAVYGNYVRAYRAPDYGAYTTVQYAYINAKDPTRTPTLLNPTAATFPKDPADVITTDERGRTLYMNPYIDDNEIINSIEGGFRKSFDDFSFDGGVFYNTIQNRLVSTFVGAIAVSVPGGNNKIVGTEMSLIWTPQQAKGFFARTSITLQDAEYTKLNQAIDFGGGRREVINLAGKKTANVPKSIWNLSVGYENQHWGTNLNSNYLGKRPADPHNTVDYPAYSLVDFNAYLNVPLKGANFRIKGNIYNLLNVQAAGNVISAVTDNYLLFARGNNFSGTSTYVRGVPIIPRRGTLALEFSF